MSSSARDPRPYVRATSAQRCVRAGGKHNDLENVGYTARHHTFFEMLGNFSFGDYFKRDAIRFAWEFLTERLGLPADKLWVTVHVSDDEAEKIWMDEIGVDPERFSKLGRRQLLADGRYRPLRTLLGDLLRSWSRDARVGQPGSPEEDGDRYIEIWNLVFMQFDRDADGTLNRCPSRRSTPAWGSSGLPPSCRACTPTTRSTCSSNLLKAAARDHRRTPISRRQSLRVIADHIRSCAFLIVDGVLPSNEGRGYVLRRIIRRAIRHGHKLGAREAFFHKLVAALDAEMGEAYPELHEARGRIEKVLLKEEEQFARTLDHGMGPARGCTR